jgi:ubiquinone/menaquinone biosynthesis C-methylase UbiE
MHSHIEFGYPWQLIYGHLILTAILAPVAWLAFNRSWSLWVRIALAALAMWAFSAALVVRFSFGLDQTTSLPTQAFLKSGTGKVLDMGAGTGRSAIMVLQARPQATLAALDQFGTSYEQHFGEAGSEKQVLDIGQKRLRANFEAAGVDQRATILQGDMRKMPVETASFDAIVSAYAIDHLGREGGRAAFAEASRALKPGGEFLLIVIAKDFWLNYTFGPLMLHGRMPSQKAWLDALESHNFQILEAGTPPATFYFLARKR